MLAVLTALYTDPIAFLGTLALVAVLSLAAYVWKTNPAGFAAAVDKMTVPARAVIGVFLGLLLQNRLPVGEFGWLITPMVAGLQGALRGGDKTPPLPEQLAALTPQQSAEFLIAALSKLTPEHRAVVTKFLQGGEPPLTPTIGAPQDAHVA